MKIFRHNTNKTTKMVEDTVPITQLIIPIGDYTIDDNGVIIPETQLKMSYESFENCLEFLDDKKRNGKKEGKAYYTTEDKNLLLTRKNPDDAGLDIKAMYNALVPAHGDAIIQTGIRVQIPRGYVGIIKSRSGLSVKNKIEVGAGVIDSNYRGELMVHLYNFGDSPFVISKGDRIAQLITLPYYMPEYHIIDELDETKRGENGFGSSGR